MRIAMVSEHANPLADFGGPDTGGQNVHVAELSAALTRQGHDVTVYTRRDDPDVPQVVTATAGYRVHHVTAGPRRRIPKDDIYPHLGAFADELADVFSVERPDVVHAHFWMSGVVSLLSASPLDIPVAVTFHALGAEKRRFQGAEDTSPRSRIAMETVVARHADMIVATCSAEAFELARMGASPRRTSIHPCGVDVDTFAPSVAPADPLGGRRARHRVVSVGRLVPRKGFDTAIDALAALPDAELVIVGGPADRPVLDDQEGARLWSRACDRGVQDRLRMPGQMPRETMPAILGSADLVTCTPWYEPFGMVPLEAMASGTPVVAAAVGGLRDTVRDGVTGELVPPRNPGALAESLRSLLDDPGRRASYAQQGLDRVRSRYTWGRIADDLARVYHRLHTDTVDVPADRVSGEATHG